MNNPHSSHAVLASSPFLQLLESVLAYYPQHQPPSTYSTYAQLLQTTLQSLLIPTSHPFYTCSPSTRQGDAHSDPITDTSHNSNTHPRVSHASYAWCTHPHLLTVLIPAIAFSNTESGVQGEQRAQKQKERGNQDHHQVQDQDQDQDQDQVHTVLRIAELGLSDCVECVKLYVDAIRKWTATYYGASTMSMGLISTGKNMCNDLQARLISRKIAVCMKDRDIHRVSKIMDRTSTLELDTDTEKLFKPWFMELLLNPALLYQNPPLVQRSEAWLSSPFTAVLNSHTVIAFPNSCDGVIIETLFQAVLDLLQNQSALVRAWARKIAAANLSRTPQHRLIQAITSALSNLSLFDIHFDNPGKVKDVVHDQSKTEDDDNHVTHLSQGMNHEQDIQATALTQGLAFMITLVDSPQAILQLLVKHSYLYQWLATVIHSVDSSGIATESASYATQALMHVLNITKEAFWSIASRIHKINLTDYIYKLFTLANHHRILDMDFVHTCLTLVHSLDQASITYQKRQIIANLHHYLIQHQHSWSEQLYPVLFRVAIDACYSATFPHLPPLIDIIFPLLPKQIEPDVFDDQAYLQALDVLAITFTADVYAALQKSMTTTSTIPSTQLVRIDLPSHLQQFFAYHSVLVSNRSSEAQHPLHSNSIRSWSTFLCSQMPKINTLFLPIANILLSALSIVSCTNVLYQESSSSQAIACSTLEAAFKFLNQYTDFDLDPQQLLQLASLLVDHVDLFIVYADHRLLCSLSALFPYNYSQDQRAAQPHDFTAACILHNSNAFVSSLRHALNQVSIFGLHSCSKALPRLFHVWVLALEKDSFTQADVDLLQILLQQPQVIDSASLTLLFDIVEMLTSLILCNQDLISNYILLWKFLSLDAHKRKWTKVLLQWLRETPLTHVKEIAVSTIHQVFRADYSQIPTEYINEFKAYFKYTSLPTNDDPARNDMDSSIKLPKLTKMERRKLEYQLRMDRKRRENDANDANNAMKSIRGMQIDDHDHGLHPRSLQLIKTSRPTKRVKAPEPKFEKRQRSDLHKDILKIDPLRIHAMLDPDFKYKFPRTGRHMPIQDYCNMWDSLIFCEFKASLIQTMNEIRPLLQQVTGSFLVNAPPEHFGSITAIQVELNKADDINSSTVECDYSFRNIAAEDLVMVMVENHQHHSSTSQNLNILGIVATSTDKRKRSTKGSNFQIHLSPLPNANFSPGKKIKICRIMSLIPFYRQFDALWNLDQLPSGLRRSLLSGEITCDTGAEVSLFHGNSVFRRLCTEKLLNKSQLDAISKILHASSRTQRFHLIQGPPGTGKTSSILGLLSCLLSDSTLSTENQSSRKRILVCAPSNIALDEIMTRLNDKGLLSNAGTWKPNMLRIGSGSKARELDEFSLSKIISKKFSNDGNEEKSSLHLKKNNLRGILAAINKSIGEVHAQRAQLIEELKNTKGKSREEISAYEEEEKNATKSLAKLHADLNAKSDEFKALDLMVVQQREQADVDFKRFVDQQISAADIVLSTLNSAGHEHLSKAECSFDYIVIDEAAQAIESDILIPLTSTSDKRCSQCIMFGDAMQLPATVLTTCPKASRMLSTSLLERLQESSSETASMLNVQYRMHPLISYFPSYQFYNSKLLCSTSVKASMYHKNFHDDGKSRFGPVTFYNTSRTSTFEDKSYNGSLRNKGEAGLVTLLLLAFKEDYPEDFGKHTIGILTPYRSQVKEIQDSLASKSQLQGKPIDVSTIDGAQGNEKDIIIFSTVRKSASNGKSTIGFLKDSRRMNVALSRAKFTLILFGDAELLSNTSEDWSLFVKHCKENQYLLDLESDNQLPRLGAMPSKTIEPDHSKTPMSVPLVILPHKNKIVKSAMHNDNDSEHEDHDEIADDDFLDVAETEIHNKVSGKVRETQTHLAETNEKRDHNSLKAPHEEINPKPPAEIESISEHLQDSRPISLRQDLSVLKKKSNPKMSLEPVKQMTTSNPIKSRDFRGLITEEEKNGKPNYVGNQTGNRPGIFSDDDLLPKAEESRTFAKLSGPVPRIFTDPKTIANATGKSFTPLNENESARYKTDRTQGPILEKTRHDFLMKRKHQHESRNIPVGGALNAENYSKAVGKSSGLFLSQRNGTNFRKSPTVSKHDKPFSKSRTNFNSSQKSTPGPCRLIDAREISMLKALRRQHEQGLLQNRKKQGRIPRPGPEQCEETGVKHSNSSLNDTSNKKRMLSELLNACSETTTAAKRAREAR